jgi:hypothetical protein
MPLLEFNGVYLVTSPPGELRGCDLAVGARAIEHPPGPSKKKPWVGFEWISVNDSGMGGHRMFGIPLREGKLVEIQVTSYGRWETSPPIIFRFEPLTHDLFTRMGEAGWVTNYKKIAAHLPDDAAVRNYFLQLYMAEGWEETPS